MLTKPKLSKRLACVVDFVPAVKTVADIGCDHAYVAIALVLKNKAHHVYAIDNKIAPLRVAQTNVDAYDLHHAITLLHNPIAHTMEPLDGCIIAGVGKTTAVAILDEFEHNFGKNTYVCLQVNTQIIEMRKHMAQRGYRLIDERVVLDKDYYVMLLYEKGIEVHTDVVLWIGPYLLQNLANNREYFKALHHTAAHFRRVAHNQTKRLVYTKIDDYLQGIL